MFKYFDYYFMILGIKFLRSNWIITLINNLIFILITCSSLAILVIRSFDQTQWLVKLTYILGNGCFIFCNLWFRYKRQLVLNYRRQLELKFDNQSKSELRRFYRITIRTIIIRFLIIFSAFGYFYSQTPAEDQVRSFTANQTLIRGNPMVNYLLHYVDLIQTIGQLHWIQFGSNIYSYVAVSIEVHKRQWIRKIMATIDLNQNQLIRLLIELDRHRQLSNHFEQHFNILPLTWLSFIFVGVSGSLRHLSSENVTSPAAQLMTYSMIGSTAIVMFAMIHSVNQGIEQTQSFYHQLYQKLTISMSHIQTIPNIRTSDRSGYIFLAIKLDIEKKTIYTASGLFDLNNGLIITFTSGLISFTVMFLQLSG